MHINHVRFAVVIGLAPIVTPAPPLSAEETASAPPSNGIVERVEPADPDLIPEARDLVSYLRATRGRGILTGTSRNEGGPRRVLHYTGREPAIRHLQATFFLEPELAGQTLDAALYWGREKGGIVHLYFGWGWPIEGGINTKGQPQARSSNRGHHPLPPDIGKVVTPGTEEYAQFHKDLGTVADYLEKVADARLPVLWWAIAETDGGWFWWTDTETPENTAALYRQMFDYLVNERGIHNLIWIYEAAHISHRPNRPKDATIEEEAAWRRRFYPGDAYVDVAGIATFGNARQYTWGWGNCWSDSYPSARELLQAIAPGPAANGLLAITQSAPSLINPELARRNGPEWVWNLAWFNGATAWDQHTWNHDHFITLDELPLFDETNVTPNVRITYPAEGVEVRSDHLHLHGIATDRNGNLESVSIYALNEPWRSWATAGGNNYIRGDEVVREVFGEDTLLGLAKVEPDGRWSFTWRAPPKGFHNLVAFARDTAGAMAESNAVRFSVGMENLARGKSVTASSESPWGSAPAAASAVDDDPNTAWRADHREDVPQWLRLDLGTERTISGVSVYWWAARATDYLVQVSTDGEHWREAFQVKDQRGEMDLLRFDPVRARYVRLFCTQRAVDWASYCIFDLGVYERLP